MKPPAFQFYADDFIGGTVDLTTEQVGAYIRLLCYQWNKGAIPDNAEAINRVAGCVVHNDVITKFPNLRNERLERERSKQEEYRRKQSENGKRGMKSRWNEESGYNGAITTLQPKHNSPSPSPIVEREREASLPEIPPMSRKDYDSLCQMRGIPTECADWFWNTHDARNWTDATGQIIRKVEPVLLNAFKNWRAKASQAQSGSKPSQSVYSITKVIEAKKEQADGLKARWAVETGLDTTWSSEKAKADYRELKKEIKELNQKLAGMA